MRSKSSPSATCPVYGRFDLTFLLPGPPPKNPFDFREIDVAARVQTSSGVSIVPAFYDGPGSDGAPLWCARITPTRPGAHAISILRDGRPVEAARIVSGALAFRAVASGLPGFVTRDPANRQRFLRGGKPFYPVGLNEAWRNGRDAPYPTTFAKMKAADCTWTRIWSDHFGVSKNLEWSANRPPLGTYDLEVARRWDGIFDVAATFGVTIQMCLQHHGQYSTRTNPNWNDNPYNVRNGGFLARPDDFFTERRALALTEQKYRYIVARWGYATHLFAWELFNEVQFTDGTRERWPVVGRWHTRMAAFLRAHDPHRHLVTTSADADEKNPIFAPCDVTQEHVYTNSIEASLLSLTTAKRSKPFFVGEWGGAGDGRSDDLLRRGLWTGLMTDHAAAPMWWAWDYIDPPGEDRDRWSVFAEATAFLRAAGVAERIEPVQTVAAAVENAGRSEPLDFGPPGGWAAHTRSRFVIPTDGGAPDLGGLSSFFQGTAHRDMMPRAPEFETDFPPGGGTAEIHLNTISRAGARLEVFLDDKPVASETFPAADSDTRVNRTFTVPVPEGRHVLRIASTGPDWFGVRGITLSPYAPGFGAVARVGKSLVTLYGRVRTDAKPVPPGARLRVPNVAPGRYAVTWWDINKRRPLSRTNATSDKRGLTLALPALAGNDIAAFAERKG